MPSSSSPLSLSSPSESSAPKALALVPPKVAGALLDAKLVKPPGLAAAAKPPPTPENPLPMEPNPEVVEGEAKPLVPLVAGLKTEGVEAPSEPNGEFSEPANAARLEEANAEVDAGLSAESLLDPREANGEAPAAFPNALAANACPC